MLKRRLKLTKEDKEWAKAVKERDGNMCVVCGETERLNAHHIIVRENHETKLDVQNGISLCPTHHFFNRQISAHNNPIGFLMWLEKNRPKQLNYLRKKMQEILDGDGS